MHQRLLGSTEVMECHYGTTGMSSKLLSSHALHGKLYLVCCTAVFSFD